ncbi:MAG: IS630 family transposase [Patescibacteria group bacterium]|nr:IS630 family transposase [Patescibacteria group bacterium]
MQAISLLDKGFQPVDVARRVGVDRRSVRRWRAEYERNGESGLKAKLAPGRPPKLNTKQRKRLTRFLIQSPRTVGFATDLWTCPRVAKVIRDEFHIDYHVDHIGRILHSLGFSPQKPERRAIERDENAIQRWVRHTWPGIKKKPEN